MFSIVLILCLFALALLLIQLFPKVPSEPIVIVTIVALGLAIVLALTLTFTGAPVHIGGTS